jgi:DNA-binding MurR/RpiR family transcriptional regulator
LNGDARLFEGLKSICKEDILIAISFPRYTNATIEAIQFARNHQATTVSISDSQLSPVAQMCDFALITPVFSSHFTSSYAGCICLINLIVTVIIHLNTDQAQKMLCEWEEALEKFHFHYESRVLSIPSNIVGKTSSDNPKRG